MAVALQNSVPVTENINTASFGVGRYVADGEKWGGAVGTGVTLDFSFPGYGSIWKNPYGSSDEPFGNGYFVPLTQLEQSAAIAAMNTWSQFVNVNFVQVAEVNDQSGFGTVGEIRFAKSYKLGNTESAHAYFPSGQSNPQAGDVWFNPRNQFNHDGGSVPAGSFDFQTILHELGHALGLKHTFDDANFGPANHAPVSHDNYFYSIMSYTASPWSAPKNNFATFYPTTPMYDDLVAMETLYGRRLINTGDTTYNFNDGVRYWQAINDGGGRDMIAYNGAENSTINLNPGTFSAVSEAIAFHRPNGTTVTSRATVTIGPNVLIEYARGGSGNDTLTGNNIANSLQGMNGNDVLNGLNGNDVLKGGNGNDSLRGGFGNDTLTGGPNNDVFLFNAPLSSSANRDIVTDYNVAQDSIYLENAIFTHLPLSAHLNPAYFRAGTVALDANDYIIYNRANGLLSYDPDGNHAGSALQIAVLLGHPLMTAYEFTVF